MRRLMNFYLSFFLLSMAAPTWAQWVPFLEKEKAFFVISDEEYFLGASFDEVEIQSDRKIIYPDSDSSCQDCPNHWLGKQIDVFPNGDHIFYNRKGEECLIRASAKLNEEWVVYTGLDETLIGQCVDISSKEVLGVMDSVKTFHFYMVDTNGNPTNHMANTAEFQISQNHGYLTMQPFLDFPEGVWFMNTEYYLRVTLESFEGDGVGFESVKWNEVNDHEPGDELHIIEGNGYEDWNFGSTWYESYYQKYIILSKESFTDEVVYQVKKDQFYRYTLRFEPVDSALTSEIIEWRFPIKNEDFDRFENIRSQNGFNLGIQSPFGPAKLFNVLRFDPFGVDDLTQYVYSEHEYIRGAGGPYFSSVTGFADKKWRGLIYSHNKFGEHGTPLDSMLFVDRVITSDTIVIDTIFTTGTMNVGDSLFYVDHIRVSPNPFENQLIVSTDSTTSLDVVWIFDINGEQVWNLHGLFGYRIEINLDLPAGVYLCKVLTKNDNVVYRRIFKMIDPNVIDTMVIDTMMIDTMNIVDTVFYVEHINIGPNPFDRHLTISADSTTLLQSVTLFNLSGEIVWIRTSLNGQMIEVDIDLPTGVYLCQVLTSNNKTVTRKIYKL